MRVAFLTTEFVTEWSTGGGLGNYLNRIAQALRALGHQPEIFVTSMAEPAVIEHEGITIHRVRPEVRRLAFQVGWKVSRLLGIDQWTGHRLALLCKAASLASALHRRERAAPFDLVQSADWEGSGLFVRRRRDRPHLVRCSTAPDLYAESDRDAPPTRLFQARVEIAAIRRADVAYAPSRLVADHLTRVTGRSIGVVRPPALLEHPPAITPPQPLPDRYFVHFGQLMPRKGAAWLAEALPLAWAQEPGLTMVWAGIVWRPDDLTRWAFAWGPHRDRVLYLGALPKPQLYAVLRDAEAAVLPSLIDNLPNTAIESLMLGLPVIGSAGASIDELVEPGITGELVHLGDVLALAAALVRFWRGQSPVRKGFRWQAPIAQEMDPAHAVANLLQLAESARSLGRARRHRPYSSRRIRHRAARRRRGSR